MEAQDRDAVVYPDSDGEPMADNTLQFEWIVEAGRRAGRRAWGKLEHNGD